MQPRLTPDVAGHRRGLILRRWSHPSHERSLAVGEASARDEKFTERGFKADVGRLGPATGEARAS